MTVSRARQLLRDAHRMYLLSVEFQARGYELEERAFEEWERENGPRGCDCETEQMMPAHLARSNAAD